MFSRSTLKAAEGTNQVLKLSRNKICSIRDIINYFIFFRWWGRIIYMYSRGFRLLLDHGRRGVPGLRGISG